LVRETYKTQEEYKECENKKASIHALIVIKICINDNIDFNIFDGDLNTAKPTGESIVSMLVQYERIIVNGKFYSETYMDKKTVETLCDDEPVEQKEFDIRNENKYLPTDSTEDMRQNDDEEINEEDFENINKPVVYDLGTADTVYRNPEYHTSLKSREEETFANDFDDYEEENFGGGRKRRTKKRKHFRRGTSSKCHKTSKKKCKKTLKRKGQKTLKRKHVRRGTSSTV
jgi:hypothetical protein